ncbi:hypothetical protein HOD08_02875 [bacterium]|nr:hypothetical protein [bacterium]
MKTKFKIAAFVLAFFPASSSQAYIELNEKKYDCHYDLRNPANLPANIEEIIGAMERFQSPSITLHDNSSEVFFDLLTQRPDLAAKIEKIIIEDDNLTHVLDSIGFCSNLRTLHIYSESLIHISEQLGNIHSLENLCITGSQDFKFLPSSLRRKICNQDGYLNFWLDFKVVYFDFDENGNRVAMVNFADGAGRKMCNDDGDGDIKNVPLDIQFAIEENRNTFYRGVIAWAESHNAHKLMEAAETMLLSNIVDHAATLRQMPEEIQQILDCAGRDEAMRSIISNGEVQHGCVCIGDDSSFMIF